jgi:hypothetical protein
MITGVGFVGDRMPRRLPVVGICLSAARAVIALLPIELFLFGSRDLASRPPRSYVGYVRYYTRCGRCVCPCLILFCAESAGLSRERRAEPSRAEPRTQNRTSYMTSESTADPLHMDAPEFCVTKRCNALCLDSACVYSMSANRTCQSCARFVLRAIPVATAFVWCPQRRSRGWRAP